MEEKQLQPESEKWKTRDTGCKVATWKKHNSNLKSEKSEKKREAGGKVATRKKYNSNLEWKWKVKEKVQ